MNEPSVYVCRVDTAEGDKDYVTLIPPEVAFTQGLAPEAIVGVLSRPLQPDEPITPEMFARNPVFVEFLHEVIARNGPTQPGVLAEAKRLGNGFVVVVDRRTPTPEGPVPPEDIIGFFKIDSGKVVEGSYQRSPNHRILSANGFFRLDPGLHKCLLKDLAARNCQQ